MRFTYDDNYFNALYQGIPNGGYTAMVEKMLADTEVRLNVDYLAEKAALDALAEKVVYTGPVDAYFGYRLGALQYRSVRFETEVLDTDNYQGNAVVNYTDAETPYTRIIEHKHFEMCIRDRAGPDLVSRGFVYVRENESLMDGAQSIVENALERCVDEHVRDWNSVKTRVREALSSYIYRRTKRSPMILPILMEV